VSFFKNVSKISFWTIASRVAGFAREMMVANFLGAGIVVDALVLSLKFPSFIRRLCAEGTMNTCFVPIFASLLQKNKEEQAKIFAASVFVIFSAALLVMVSLFVFFADSVITFMFPGLLKTPERLAYAIHYARIIFPFVAWISITSIYGAVLNTREYFSAFAASPFVGNLSIITFVLFGLALGVDKTNAFDIGSLFAWGILVSGAVQFCVVFVDAWKRGLLLPIIVPKWSRELRSFFKRLFPAALGAGVSQINLFIGMLIASMLPAGNISYLNYADRLVQLPLSVIGTAMGVALLPVLVRELHAGRVERANRQQELALGVSFFASFLITVLFVSLSAIFVKIVFEHGRFNATDALQTARALSAYAWGLPAYIMVKVLSARFFARGRVLFPLICGLVSVGVDIVLSLILIRFMGHVGIAVATSVSAWTNVGLLALLLWQKREWRPTFELTAVFAKVVGLSFCILLMTLPLSDAVDVRSLDKWGGVGYALLGGGAIVAIFLAGGYILFGNYVRQFWDTRVSGASKKI
jgi:putative peptidoglycan lipid II flippase